MHRIRRRDPISPEIPAPLIASARPQDCLRLAADLGWPIYDEYVDNAISAFSSKHRPNCERMPDDIRDRNVDAVVVYNFDRLTRQPTEFEEFNLILQSAGVSNVRFVTSDVQVGLSDGLFEARIRSAMAADKSANLSGPRLPPPSLSVPSRCLTSGGPG